MNSETQLQDTQELRVRLQQFQSLLNRDPNPAELDDTPDKKAKTLPISFVEMTLDELYFGLWETENFNWSAISNEVQGSLELVVTHPVTGQKMRRVGSASIIIQVDALNDEQKRGMNKQQINMWALSPENKKSNALDLGFPKLKAECLKNAAQSLGKIFGRDLNRKKKDTYKPIASDKGSVEMQEKITRLLTQVALDEAFKNTLESEIPTMDYIRQKQVINFLEKNTQKQLAGKA